MPDAPTPTPPAPSATPSRPPPLPAPIHWVVQAIDRFGEIAAVCWAGYLCLRGRLSPELFMLFSGAVLGVQTGIHKAADVKTGSGVSGALGLLVALAGGAALARHLVIGGALALLATATLAGCPWRATEPDCTTPGAYDCADNRPHRCMSNRVLRPLRPTCGAGERCQLTPGLFGAAVAACVPATDAAPATDATDGSDR